MSLRRVPVPWGEWVAVLAVAVFVAYGLGHEVGHLQIDAPADAVRSVDQVAAGVWTGFVEWFVGILLLLGGRWMTLVRGGERTLPAAQALVPALALATGLGLLLQCGYGDVLRVAEWSGPRFADGVLAGGAIGALVLAVPTDLGERIERGQLVLVAIIVGTLAALALLGAGPEGSAARIRLGPVQPLEAVKVAFVLFVAGYLGRRAALVRWHREVWAGLLQVPRIRLLAPAVGVLAALSLGLFWVRDLGPTLVVSLVFLVLLFVVLRSLPWVLIALGVVGAVVTTVVLDPGLLGSVRVETRLRMWLDPWLNGLPSGDQLAHARWAVASGGWFGLGLGDGPAFPAGHTDLTVAHLAQELGFVGVALYFLALAALTAAGLWIAGFNRTPPRVLAAAGLTWLVLGQAAVIVAGTTGLLPLTGIVVPFLSAGRSAGTMFVVLVALLAKLAEQAAVRADTEVLRELRQGVRASAIVSAVGGGLLLLLLFVQGVLQGPATAARVVVTRLADGRVVTRMNPRVATVLAQIPRGPILDRNGRALAITEGGERRYPYGAAMGALLGPADPDVLRDPLALERWWDPELRGYPDHRDGPAVWLGPHGEALFVVPSREERPGERAEAERISGGEVRLLPLPNPDLSGLVPYMGAPSSQIAALAEDVGARTVTTTLDGELQQAAARALAHVASDRHAPAAAAVVIDVDTGQVLVRAQVPDYDPGGTGWLAPVVRQDPQFTGMYGAWVDQTGPRGVQQAGSISKVFTALAAAREGQIAGRGSGCDLRTEPLFTCAAHGADGPSFRGDGWGRAIHDLGRDTSHGELDLVHALAVSCNVYFAQLGLAVGPRALSDLVRDGLAVGTGAYDPGEPDSFKLGLTAIGQGAAAYSPLQAARMVATVGAGGVYRVCPNGLSLDAECTEALLVQNAAAVSPILAGMAQVMTTGTGAGLAVPRGVRVYGKTGTADAIGVAAERPYGITPGAKDAEPHSWFVALAEPESAAPCGQNRGRLALAVLVDRGGSGRAGAARAAMEIVSAAAELGYFGERR